MKRDIIPGAFLLSKTQLGPRRSSVPTGRDYETNLVYLGSDVVSKYLDFPKTVLSKASS